MDMSKIPEKDCYDNSQVECFRNCARKFYFTYIRHWKPARANIHLGFGSAWHEAMDVVWELAPDESIPDIDIVTEAMVRFYAYWKIEGLSLDDEYLVQVYPKTPGRAKEMLEWYLKKYRNYFFLHESFSLIATEEPFIVPLGDDDNIYYMGRWDKVYNFNGEIVIADHKTTKSNKTQWAGSFSPNSQIDGYIFAGHASYGDTFWGVMIDGALVQKGSKSIDGMPAGVGFPRIPVRRLFGHLESWRYEALYYISMIKYNKDLLADLEGSENTYLACFPKNTSYCNTYGGCIYKNICIVVPNPELKGTPDGFIVKAWSPLHGKEKVDTNEK